MQNNTVKIIGCSESLRKLKTNPEISSHLSDASSSYPYVIFQYVVDPKMPIDRVRIGTNILNLRDGTSLRLVR